MAMSNQAWETWLERIYNLRRDKTGTHERPHKPVLLLSIIDLLDRGVITRNEVPLSNELVETFKRYFEVVRKHNDQPTIQNPFFHLCGDKFWKLVPAAGEGIIYHEGATSGAPSVAELRRRTVGGQFEAGLWALLSEPVARHQLREALIARYFPEEHDRLATIAAANRSAKPAEALKDELPPGPGRSLPSNHFGNLRLSVRRVRCADVAGSNCFTCGGSTLDSVQRLPKRQADERSGTLPKSPLGHGSASDCAMECFHRLSMA